MDFYSNGNNPKRVTVMKPNFIQNKKFEKERHHKIIDLITMGLSITFFFVFNIVYWSKMK